MSAPDSKNFTAREANRPVRRRVVTPGTFRMCRLLQNDVEAVQVEAAQRIASGNRGRTIDRGDLAQQPIPNQSGGRLEAVLECLRGARELFERRAVLVHGAVGDAGAS